MQKSKLQLLFKILIILLIIICNVRLIYFLYSYNIKLNKNYDEGVITLINHKSNYDVLIIKSKIKYKAYLNKSNNLKIGDKIKFSFNQKEIKKTSIPNTFNYQKYLKSENIKSIILIQQYKKIGENKYYKYKNIFYNITKNKKSKNYIYTFLSGNKSYLDIEVKNSYIDNGITHLLCVSGFHIVFLLSFIKKIIQLFTKNNLLSTIILLLFSFIYLYNTNFMIALYRAVIMYFLYHINKTYNIRLSNKNIFYIALFICVIYKPSSIYNVGFWYTFILSYFLSSYAYRFDGSSFNLLFKISLFSFIISMPLTIYINYSINILSVIYSLFFSYIVCYILYPLCFLALFSHIFDHLLFKISNIFECINLYLVNINKFRFIFPKINLYLIIFIYILFILYVNKPNIKYIFIYILVLLYAYFNIYFDNSTYVYFVDVDQGDMSIIINKYHKNIIVIDSGGIVNNLYLSNNIKTFMQSIGIRKIDAWIISHGDYDHMGNMIRLVNNFNVENVIFNCGKFNNLEIDLIKILNKKKIPYQSCIKEFKINGNKLYFLKTKEYNNENDNSNVVYTEIKGYKFMFMGDVSKTPENEIMKEYNLSNIDALKVGHHGSKTSSSVEFIKRINPKYSIISVGKNNRYGHPSIEALNNLKESKIYRTDEDGSIMFKINNNKLNIKTYNSY